MTTGEISIVISIVIQTIAVVFFYGRLTERVGAHGEKIEDHDDRLKYLERGKRS